RQHIEDLARAFARGYTFRVRRKARQVLVPSVGKFPALHSVDLVRQVRKLFAIPPEQIIPLRTEFAAATANSVLKVLQDFFRDEKLHILGPAVELLRQTNFLFAKRLAMRGVGVLLVRSAVADMAVHNHQGRTVVGRKESTNTAGDSIEVIGVGHVDDIPTVAAEASGHVFAE